MQDALWEAHTEMWRKHGKELQEVDWAYYKIMGRDKLYKERYELRPGLKTEVPPEIEKKVNENYEDGLEGLYPDKEGNTSSFSTLKTDKTAETADTEKPV